ncbi:diadenosine hexaphosphate hydrolase [Oxobacter pfennigii]|uniref:Diadenosine hexaphosphate hydrolase n=1 Tax=Oxobacter pfennigii TaxID=36849 RepID=A0A0P9AHR8_9CLOT|nr:NUDIX hydrolase [Oxobacter pfennigii]KPU45006.1 diadenosine hexaphosphate hydrolase [Oxobacter pfennigii]
MLIRNCAGGVVFDGEKVFLLKNEKDEWVLPKGVIRNGYLSNEVAVDRVKKEAGISAEIISTAGQTNYEFFSFTRKKPVCNRITWYIMKALDSSFNVSKEDGFQDGCFFTLEEALDRISYSQDKALVRLSYDKYKEMITQLALA